MMECCAISLLQWQEEMKYAADDVKDVQQCNAYAMEYCEISLLRWQEGRKNAQPVVVMLLIVAAAKTLLMMVRMRSNGVPMKCCAISMLPWRKEMKNDVDVGKVCSNAMPKQWVLRDI
jgi:hypothetical protein